MTIPRPPASIEQTRIYRRISEGPHDQDGLRNKVGRFIEAANPIVDSIIAGPFRTYTLHNRDHARKLAHLAEHITSRDTIETLSPFECLLIIYSSYLHDMGLAVTKDEVDRLLASEEFEQSNRSWPQLQRALEERRTLLSQVPEKDRARIELEIADLHGVALTHYLRPKHATRQRYKSLINQIRTALPGDDPFQIRGISFEEELIDICASHNLDAAVLGEFRNAHEDRFQRRFVAADHQANLQFVAALLRITDILDFDFERTPPVLFESLGLRNRNMPGGDVTLAEWQKHLAVQQLEIRNDELVVRAQCSHPAIEATVRQFCRIIEDEIRSTLSVLRRNSSDITDRYRLLVPPNVRPDVRSKDYKYIDLALRLDESAVMSLLMGTRLYQTPYTAARELIQNGVDATLVRQHFRPDLGQGTVEVYSVRDNDGRTWVHVKDDGIGMSEHVLRNHFFRVGSSYYSSHEFDRMLTTAKLPRIPLVSRFGIGFLATFMLADLVVVETRPVPISPHSPQDTALRVTIERLGALAYVQQDDSLPPGTTIKVRLKNSTDDSDVILSRIADHIKISVLRPGCPVLVRLGMSDFRIKPDDYYQLRDHPRTQDFFEGRLEVVSLRMEKYSSTIRGLVILFFVRDPGSGRLGVRFGERLLDFDADASERGRVWVPTAKIIKNFGGNRVTVGGFRMMFNNLGRLLRHGKSTLAAVYDIDISPNVVECDVARTRVLDENTKLRAELRRAIELGLKDIGIFQDVSDDVRHMVATKSEDDPFRLKAEVLRKKATMLDDEDLLARVKELIPSGPWPIGLHRTIAAELRISKTMAFDAISTLIVHGSVKKP